MNSGYTPSYTDNLRAGGLSDEEIYGDQPKEYGIRVECCPSTTGKWSVFELSEAAMKDQGVYETERRELWDFLYDHDKGIDAHGSFREQVCNAILDCWENDRRRDLVLADSEHCDMQVWIKKVEA